MSNNDFKSVSDNKYERWMALDRRWIFLGVAVFVLIPLLKPMSLPLLVSQPVQNVYDYIENLPEGSVILFSGDYDPGSQPELYPMNLAIIHHCFLKNHRVIAMNLWFTGVNLAVTALEETSKPHGKKDGIDYVLLGYKPAADVVMTGMGENIFDIYPADMNNNDLASLPVMKNVRNLRDVDLLVSLSAGSPGSREWVVYTHERFDLTIASGCTAVGAPELYPYLQSKQLLGLLGGLRGAAEYEKLVLARSDGKYGKGLGLAGMDAQTSVHIAIFLAVVAGNILFFLSKREEKRLKRGSA